MSDSSIDPSYLLSLCQSVVDRAQPGEQIEVVCSDGRSTTVRVYEGAVESFTSADGAAIGIRVLNQGRQGFASAGSFSTSVIEATLADARDNSLYTEADEFAGVAEPDGVAAVEIDLWSEAQASVGTETKIDYALRLERMVRSADSRITSVRSTTYGDSVGAFALASTSGITAATRATSSSVSVHALAADGDGATSGFGFDGARNHADLDLEYVAKRAAGRAVDLIGGTQPETGLVSLVLGPHEAATFLGLVTSTLTGDRIERTRSPFVDRLDTQIASSLLTVLDDPTNPESLGADSHDGEGLACRPNPLIVDGRLNRFVYDSYYGRMAGAGSTGSAVRGTRGLPYPGIQALEVRGSSGSLEELIAGVDRGILVFSFDGLHSGVNPISGDLSVGVRGLRIENGRLGGPVSECTAASTLQKMLQNISAVGSDAKPLASGSIMPSLVIEQVMLAGA